MDCVAHRGFAAVAPENTVRALSRAAEMAPMVEFDVRRCATGEPVVIHDETVDRVTDGTGRVDELGRADLAALNVLETGAGVPTLAAVLEAIPADTALNVELKERGLVPDVVVALEDAAHDVLVSSFDDETLREVGDVSTLARANVFSEDPRSGLEDARRLDVAAVHPQWELIDRPFVERAHDLGLAVNCWTARSDAATKRAGDVGVDGLISDAPRFCRL